LEKGGQQFDLVMEKTFQDKIENFVPNQSDYEEVDALIELVKHDIIRAKFDQLLPPVPQVKLDLSKATLRTPEPGVDPEFIEINTQEESDDDEEEEEDQADHIDLTRVLPHLNFLTHVELSFGVKDVGMNFEWGFFTFTMNDAEMLATCLAKCYSLETLAITRSRLEDDQARVMIKRLLSHPRLRSINLSHNRLKCKTGRALGKMIKTVSTLEELNLEDNEIGEEGATAIALGIQCETAKLKSLNISQNIIGDNGGIAICKALMVNTTLTDLSIGANGLGLIFAKSLSATLANNSTLQTMNIVSNTIGLEGGQSLSSGMDLNTSLRKIDLRLSGAGLEAEHAIANKLKSNSETKISA